MNSEFVVRMFAALCVLGSVLGVIAWTVQMFGKDELGTREKSDQ
jgi:hypothetical protein